MTVLRNSCPVGSKCPTLHDYKGGDAIVQGYRLDLVDADKLAELAIPEGEAAVVVPMTLLEPSYISVEELDRWLRERFTRDLLRIENRRAYEVDSDGSDFRRFLQGEDEPTVGATWFDQLDQEFADGKTRRKVHVHTGTLSDYERYACAWGYTRTVAHHEQVRMTEDPAGLFDGVPDFYVLDGVHVLRMDYADDHTFLGALPIAGPDAAVYRALAATIWRQGVDFIPWWAAHPAARRRVA